MTEKEKQELYTAISNDINCGTFILAPQYVDKLINKYTKKHRNYLKAIMKIIQKFINTGEKE
jgi:predicted peptidase